MTEITSQVKPKCIANCDAIPVKLCPVYQLVNDVANAKNDSKFSLAIYLDIAKAFDSINHDYLLRKLHMIAIRGMYLKWLKIYMTDRKQIVLNENYQSTEHKQAANLAGFRASEDPRFEAGIPDFMNGILNFSIHFNVGT